MFFNPLPPKRPTCGWLVKKPVVNKSWLSGPQIEGGGVTTRWRQWSFYKTLESSEGAFYKTQRLRQPWNTILLIFYKGQPPAFCKKPPAFCKTTGGFFYKTQPSRQIPARNRGFFQRGLFSTQPQPVRASVRPKCQSVRPMC